MGRNGRERSTRSDVSGDGPMLRHHSYSTLLFGLFEERSGVHVDLEEVV